MRCVCVCVVCGCECNFFFICLYFIFMFFIFQNIFEKKKKKVVLGNILCLIVGQFTPPFQKLMTKNKWKKYRCEVFNNIYKRKKNESISLSCSSRSRSVLFSFSHSSVLCAISAFAPLLACSTQKKNGFICIIIIIIISARSLFSIVQAPDL